METPPAVAVAVDASIPELVALAANGRVREAAVAEDKQPELATLLTDDDRHQYFYAPWADEERGAGSPWQQQVSSTREVQAGYSL